MRVHRTSDSSGSTEGGSFFQLYATVRIGPALTKATTVLYIYHWEPERAEITIYRRQDFQVPTAQCCASYSGTLVEQPAVGWYLQIPLKLETKVLNVI